jgi:hypothetical protein
MRGLPPNYLAATRHPWASVLFVLPLLIFYESGLYFLGNAPMEAARNGADAWLRGILQQMGISPLYGAPVLLAGVLLGWSAWRYRDRPRAYGVVWLGMLIESGVFALGLLCLSHLLFPALQAFSGVIAGPPVPVVLLNATSPSLAGAWEQLIGYVGAGIYEETLFRLLLFSGLVLILRYVESPMWLAVTAAAAFSALAFAGAHHLGSEGEPFQPVIFLFRTCAGLYFTWVFQVRGFGIAVGAHAFYDVLVGILIRR